MNALLQFSFFLIIIFFFFSFTCYFFHNYFLFRVCNITTIMMKIIIIWNTNLHHNCEFRWYKVYNYFTAAAAVAAAASVEWSKMYENFCFSILAFTTTTHVEFVHTYTRTRKMLTYIFYTDTFYIYTHTVFTKFSSIFELFFTIFSHYFSKITF